MTITKKQYNNLASLAYWRAELAYCTERASMNSTITTADLDRARRNIEEAFPVLDRLGVPFFCQNVALIWAEDWRRYSRGYLWQELKKRGVEVVYG